MACPTTDTLGRPLGTLRVSVTDRCNLRCHYCMPQARYRWLPHPDLLTFEELHGLIVLFGELGVGRVRLTGGEPLLRRSLSRFIAMLAPEPWLQDLALTTNGVLLAECASELKHSGLSRVTISLDTLRPERFHRLTGMDALPRVLAGLDAARRAGFTQLKLNAVITRGDNDDELTDLLEFARSIGAEIRFIEYMRVGGATRWRPEAVVSRRGMLDRLERRYGPVAPVADDPAAPAARFRLPDGLTFGIISSTTHPFCGTCTRARLTADGVLFLCLHAQRGVPLGRALRAGAPRQAVRDLIRAEWQARADRGALARPHDDTSLVAIRSRRQPHLEMHTLGG